MVKAKIDAGICGYQTEVQAEIKDNYQVELKIESECQHIQKLAKVLK
jgi:hypothetical protein